MPRRRVGRQCPRTDAHASHIWAIGIQEWRCPGLDAPPAAPRHSWLDLERLVAETNAARSQLPAPPGEYWRIEVDVVTAADGTKARLRYELAPRIE